MLLSIYLSITVKNVISWTYCTAGLGWMVGTEAAKIASRSALRRVEGARFRVHVAEVASLPWRDLLLPPSARRGLTTATNGRLQRTAVSNSALWKPKVPSPSTTNTGAASSTTRAAHAIGSDEPIEPPTPLIMRRGTTGNTLCPQAARC
jgi:hypothetical protein